MAGIDEVGRGCLAGPVIAAAVIFRLNEVPVNGLADSKKLGKTRREVLTVAIQERAIAWSIGRAEVQEIDRINILQASLLAMQRAALGLAIRPESALVDGNRLPTLPCRGRAIVGGDGYLPVISAASILAKVWRDREMELLDVMYPGYGFAEHKGYPTKSHKASLLRLGPSPIHRNSFGPVRRFLNAIANEPSVL